MFWILVGAALILLAYFTLIRPFTYWSRRGVIQKPLVNQWLDTLSWILQLVVQAETVSEFYNKYQDKRYVGFYSFMDPVLFLRDPDLIKQITVKEFDHFVDHSQLIPEDMEPLWGKNLVALKGDRWRHMRSTMSPSFTGSKMRAMFSLMTDCAEQFVQHFKGNAASQSVEMKDALTRYANDVIASTAFGVTCNSLTEPDNEFYLMGKEATTFTGFWSNFKLFIIIALPSVARLLGFKMFTPKVCEFFRRLVITNIESREKNGYFRPDMIQLLMEARNGKLKQENENGNTESSYAIVEEHSHGKLQTKSQQVLTDDDLTAQALIFFFGGFDSVSNLMCFLVYEMALNPDVQDTLRKEVDDTLELCEGTITYDALLKMKYMDMVVTEGLRKWPNLYETDRVCVKPYTIQPEKEGEMPLRINPGEILWIPIFGIHRNPQLYPNPDRFDPERFSDDNKANIQPYTFLPFGSGPRNCIGNRFALLETKTILFYILSNFEITVTEKTSIPLKLRKGQFNIAPEGGFWVGLKARNP